jgi:hypothetical protein
MSEPLTSIWLSNEHNIGHMNLTLDQNIQKYTRWNDSMFPPFEKQSSTKVAWAQPSKRGEIIDDKHPQRLYDTD